MSKNTKNNASQSRASTRPDQPNLDSRYGEIGISAVAAALPYRSEVKKPAGAPSDQLSDERFTELVG
jgi:hypothetical protein